MRRETLVSVVVPVFNSTVTRELAERIDATFAKLPDYDYELILVDDDSTDPEVWPMLEELAANGAHIRSIQLTRNFGQQAATLCGLAEATGELVITMDDDLQHRPEDIPILLEARHHDVVIGQFAVKHHDWGQRLTSRIKGVFDRIIIGKPGNIQLSSFRMLSRSVVNGVLSCRTAQPFLPGLIFHVSRNVVGVALSHEPRRTGSSGYTWGKRLVVFSHLLINNSSLILRLVGQVGIGLALIGFALAATAAYRKVFYGIGLQGWTSLFAAQLLIGGLLLFCSGVTGEYLLRILATSERRPTFFVRVRRSGGGKALSVQPAGPKEGAPGDKKRFNTKLSVAIIFRRTAISRGAARNGSKPAWGARRPC
jgi:dolichol-phosphate mannosyltransferase/undecaprenyl-phosphate 4-deoxy-4-formamido-L-arabinose transferase